MNSQQLLYINLVIGLFFVLYFLFFRPKPKSPTRLNLRAKSSESSQSRATAAEAERQEREAKVAEVLELKKPQRSESLPLSPPLSLSDEKEALSQISCEEEQTLSPKEIRIYFVYNAHEWESHDVLGVPRGAHLQEVTAKYQHLIKTSDPSTFSFFEAAYDAILKKKGMK